MTPGTISKRIVIERLDWINRMVEEIRNLPLSDSIEFHSDHRNLFTAESCLRRALEALLDLGRHILVKGFGEGITEYKEIAVKIEEHGILPPKLANKYKLMAGYRNRLVHFYHEIDEVELIEICNSELSDIEEITFAIKSWLNSRPDILDETL